MLWLSGPVYEASTRVELSGAPAPSSPAASPGPGAASLHLNTQVETIKSERVLQIAAQNLKLRSLDELKAAISVHKTAGTRIVDITANRATGAEAALWANAVTDAYVEFKRATAISNSVASGDLINRGIRTARGQIAALDAEIKESPPNVAALRQQQATLTAQVAALQAQLRNLPESQALIKGDVVVLARAETPGEPVRPDPIKYMGIATGAGALLGAPLAFVSWRRSRSARRAVEPSPGARDGRSAPAGNNASNEARPSAPVLYDESSTIGRRLEELEFRLAAELERLNSINESMLDRFMQAAQDSGAETPGTVLEQAERMQAEWLQAINRKDKESLERFGKVAQYLTQGLSQVRTEIVGRMDGQLERLGGISEEIRNSNQVTHLSGRIDEISRGLEDLKEEMAFRVGAIQVTQDTSAGLMYSVEAKLEELTSTLTARVGAFAEEVGAHIRAVDDRFTGVVEQINLGFRDAFRLSQGEFSQQMRNVDQEMTQRFGRIAGRLSQALESLRAENVETKAAYQKGVTATLEFLEESRGAEAQEAARRLNGVLEHIGNEIRAVEAKSARALAEMKEAVLARTRSDRAAAAENLTRMEDFATDVSRKVTKLSSRMSQELSAQLEELLERLDSLERKVEDQAVAASKRISSSSRTIGKPVGGLDGSRKGTGANGEMGTPIASPPRATHSSKGSKKGAQATRRAPAAPRIPRAKSKT